MQGFISAYYRPIALILGVSSLILAFLIGYEEGKAKQGNSITLSCDERVLSALEVPLDRIVAGGDTLGVTASGMSQPTVAGAAATAANGAFVGSKNGTKYYLPACSTVKRIKPENYVWFESEEDARLQGYSEGSC